MAHVVIVGAGIGGMTAAYDLRAERKMKKGTTEPIYEKYTLKALGIKRLESEG